MTNPPGDSRVTPQAVQAAAAKLSATHWDGAGCGTNGAMGCSYCFGPSPASAHEVAQTVLAAAVPLLCQPLQDENERLRGEHRDLTRRLEFGDGITEPQADNDTIVAWVEQESRDAAEWRESQRWRADCYQAGHPDDEDCAVHDPALRLERAEAEVDRLRGALLDAEHRLRLLADRTDDYGPEGMRTRLIREFQIIALAAVPVGTGNPTQPRADD